MALDEYHQFLQALARKREPAMIAARSLIEAQQYDQAEAGVKHVDDSIYGGVALASLYRQWLTDLVAMGLHQSNPAQVEEVFRRALHWAYWAYPEPHTACEVEVQTRGQAESLADLIQILGYEPQP